MFVPHNNTYTMNITYRGIELTVEGSYTEGQITGYFEEDLQPTYEVYEVLIDGNDITVLLDMQQIEEIESLILESL